MDMKFFEKLEPWVKLSLFGLGNGVVLCLIALLACTVPILAGLLLAAYCLFWVD